ncbi:hypothetical protein GYMLUDRAFT_175659 [Collybiopsis luxurians FD-317 M1]|uniref:Helicase C-terminal domain-containing protein n=1 Tax=Collybiopsis luxurians FD-317 M1 TaxID=944289 RepID=A0A0D0CK26_9AGAR|nr:hypothetical protein GYMLUDRAFT_175659 [Collybiopsis luxurians FD-317 M1]
MLHILNEIKSRPGNEKTVIFLQFTSVLDIIQSFLSREGINYTCLDGTMNTTQRKEALNAVKMVYSTTVVLVLLMAGGTGINLGACNNVILFDLWWNPAIEEQAVSRAHHMGQKKAVHVYKLVTVGTVERCMLEVSVTFISFSFRC